jgi:phage I-like protein
VILAAGSATNPLDLFLNYGLPGVVILLLATGVLVPKPTHQAVVDERDTLKVENQALQAARIADQTAFVPRADYQAVHDELARLRTKMEDNIIPGMFQYGASLDRALTALSRYAERAPA